MGQSSLLCLHKTYHLCRVRRATISSIHSGSQANELHNHLIRMKTISNCLSLGKAVESMKEDT